MIPISSQRDPCFGLKGFSVAIEHDARAGAINTEAMGAIDTRDRFRLSPVQDIPAEMSTGHGIPSLYPGHL